MRGRRTVLATMAALTIGAGAGTLPVAAQDGDVELPAPDPYGYEDGPDDEEGFRRRFRREGGGRGGSVCITARGNCVVAPAPYGAPCGCVIPGFGPKRGAIGE